MADELLKQVETLGENVRTVKEQAKDAESAALKANLSAKEAKDAVENYKKETEEAKAQVQEIKVKADEHDKHIQALKEAQNDFIAAQKSMKLGAGGSMKSFESELEEGLQKSKDKLGSKSRFELNMATKTVGNMGSAANLTGTYFVPPTVVPGIVLSPYEDIHMRNILPVGRTDSNLIRHVRDLGGEGGPTSVAEGGAKPQLDRDLSIVDATVRKIATHIRIPEEMIEDIPYITTFLSNMGTQEVLKVEDQQIIYGDGTGQNLSGLFTNGTAFAAGAVVLGASSNRFDVLRAARLQLRKAQRTPSFAMVSPLDWFMLTSLKDTTNNYILQGGGNGLVPNLDGVPIIENTALTDGDFIVMDKNAAQIFFRSGITVKFFEQDQDNAIKNLVTIVIEERLALPIYYTNGIVKGTFAAAITDLTS